MRRSTSSPEPQEPRRGNFTPPPRSGSAPAPDAPADPAPKPPVSGGRFSPRNWRVATRLNAILLIPVLVALVFGGLRVDNSFGTWQEAQDAENTAKLVRAALSYSNALIDERDRTAAPLLKGEKDDPIVQEARDATDAAAKAFHEAAGNMPDKPGLKRRMGLFEKTEPKLAQLRQAAFTPKLTGVQTEEGYVEIQHPLMEFANELGLGTGNITSYGRTVYAVALAKAAESLERSIGTHLLVAPATPENGKEHKTQLTAFASYRYLEGIAIGEYTSGGTPDDVARLKSDAAALQQSAQQQIARAKAQAQAAGRTFHAPPSIDQMSTLIASGADPSALAQRGVTPEAYFQAATGKFDMYRSIEKDLADKAVDEAAQISADARRSTFVVSGIVLAALIAAFLVAGLMARRMSHNMRELRNAAFGVAEQRLPLLVDQLSRTDPGRVDTRVQPIPISTTDEIGEVARAFDQVHREAVRLAAEQALLRGNVNAIFTNLSSRNQGLIERQLELITNLENNEADPDQLENLFRLDHLATRMRRNGENLLILAGEEPGRRWNQPVPLIDVLRAATSEVESYERIELSGVPESEIHGTAVTDLIHLLSELLENATTFSSPQTKVKVAATRLPDGRVMIEIHDKGIGLTPEDFADINHRLANPPSVDVAISQRMGLFVVGRLADRHGIRVQLRPSGEQAGTTSLVMLPEAITHGGGGDEQVDETFTVSRIVPEQPQEAYEGGTRTAAELGFDDGFHGRPGAPAGMDPVGRSLHREERRAALEAQAAAGHPAPADPRPLFRDELPADGPKGYESPQGYDAPQGYEGGQGPDGYEAHQGHQEPSGPYAEPGRPLYDDRSFGGEAFGEPDPAQSTGQHPFAPHDPLRDPLPADAWAEQPVYDGYFGTEAESDRNAPAAPADAPERVPFERPGPTASVIHSLTEAGLPRRGTGSPQDQQQTAPEPGQDDGSAWRSENDERWQRAGRLRQPSAGGVTASGLPRRVPKANLVEGTAEQSAQGGPQVSRAPEDVRGRLSNLRRGVQQGRSAGTGTDPSPGVPQNDQQGFGPGSTYDQER
ncbi:nitrate- and nitrite sensing domain-containing protein [Streptomyces sp. RS10V-4]|uniref:nitrate- and nitrite sensing domain-containing protein n=1 Tax=Streptomyces rhizoryzae TaxID=2932493 RepID=UPI002004FFEA|nr:nitrate- and nitrite sensing domain-containing protein [Streptomyces rhizoryzae]MCK7627313.1 nitrate- and nitrite sensing domain-containing protein [Streptomyces rhizoryzae]